MVCVCAASQAEFEGLEVEFVTLPGWQTPTSHARQFSELPPNTQAYIHKVEELVGVPGKWYLWSLGTL